MATDPIHVHEMQVDTQSVRLQLLREVPSEHWVALTNDESELIAHAPTLAEVMQTVKDKDASDYFITRAPATAAIFVIPSVF